MDISKKLNHQLDIIEQKRKDILAIEDNIKFLMADVKNKNRQNYKNWNDKSLTLEINEIDSETKRHNSLVNDYKNQTALLIIACNEVLDGAE